MERVEAFIGSTPRVIVASSTTENDDNWLIRYTEEHEDTKLIVVVFADDKKHLQSLFQLSHGRMVRHSEATPTNVQTNRIMVVDTMDFLPELNTTGIRYISSSRNRKRNYEEFKEAINAEF